MQKIFVNVLVVFCVLCFSILHHAFNNPEFTENFRSKSTQRGRNDTVGPNDTCGVFFTKRGHDFKRERKNSRVRLGFHIGSLFLHSASCIQCFQFLTRCQGKSTQRGLQPWGMGPVEEHLLLLPDRQPLRTGRRGIRPATPWSGKAARTF